MTKKISKASLCALVIAIAALFAASDVIAFCDNCPLPSVPQTVTLGPYTITLSSIVPTTNNPTKFIWNYTVVNTNTTELTQLNFLAMLIPVCCNAPTIEVDTNSSTPNNINVSAAAEGESTLYFGRYISQAYVIKILPNNEAYWKIVTTSNTPTETSALIRYGQGKGIAVSGLIPGPGCAEVEPECPPPVTRVEPRTQCWQFIAEEDLCHTDSTWYAEWTQADNPCAVDVYACDGIIDCGNVKEDTTNCHKITGEDLYDITTVNEDGVIQTLDAALTNNSQCSELWLRFVANGCNTRCYVSGGKKYCF